MRPCASLAICLSLTKVMVAPSAAYLTHSVASVAVNGAFGIGVMMMLSRTSCTPPSCKPGVEPCVWAMQVTALKQRIAAAEMRMKRLFFLAEPNVTTSRLRTSITPTSSSLTEESRTVRLLSCAGRRDDQPVGNFLLEVRLFLLIDEVEATFNVGRGFGEGGSQGAERAADFLTLLHDHWNPVVDRRRYRLKRVGNLPENFAAGGVLDVFVGKSGNFLVPIENHAKAVATGTFFQKIVNAPGAPERDDIGLGDDEHGIGEIRQEARGGIEAARGVDHDIAVVIRQQIEKACQFRGSGDGLIGLLRPGEQMQAVFAGGHQAFEQRSVPAMAVFESVGAPEAGAQIEMKLGVTDWSEIDQDHVAVRLLQGDGGVDRGSGCPGSSLGAEKGKDAGFSGASAGARAIGTEASESFEQRFRARVVVQKLAGPGAHTGHDDIGLLHAAVGENRQLQGIGLKQFNGADGRLRIVGGNIDDDNLGS